MPLFVSIILIMAGVLLFLTGAGRLGLGRGYCSPSPTWPSLAGPLRCTSRIRALNETP